MRQGNLENLFYQGTYSEVLKQTFDNSNWKSNSKDIPFVVGALSFAGRMEDAELLAQKLKNNIVVRFFLGIGYTRISQYSKARSLFAENLKLRKSASDNVELFFIYQGLSFFRFFSGKLELGEKSSKLSYQYAYKANHLYGKVLSTDIRAHILIQLGEISRGLKLFGEVKNLAGQLGNSSLKKAISISESIYKVRYGLDTPEKLTTAIKKLNPGDNYSHANLLLEYSRQLILRGKSNEAYQSLDEASRIIYSNQNHRQEATLNLHYAHLMYLAGENFRGLNAISSARRALNPKVDLLFVEEIKEMEQKLFDKESFRKIKKKKESPLEDLFELVREDKDTAVESILKSGYLSLLYDILPIEKRTSIIYLDLQPNSVTLFHQGNILHDVGLTPLIRKIILCLSEKKQITKEELVSKVWGYKYDPLRHDSVVYSAMTLLRKLLGEKSSWLVTTESGYSWLAGVEIKSHLKKLDLKTNTNGVGEISFALSEFNFRQIKIVQYLKKNEAIDVQQCKKLFGISDITASRDLSALTRSGSLIRIGKGRAIKYVLEKS